MRVDVDVDVDKVLKLWSGCGCVCCRNVLIARIRMLVARHKKVLVNHRPSVAVCPSVMCRH